MRVELMTPGLRDQCSATELKRRDNQIVNTNIFVKLGNL